jgi:Na+/proline symporter
MKTSSKLLHWVARILCILTILFVSLFALDSFSSERTFLQNTAAFLMHLIPSFIMLAVLIIAWKQEKAGGIIMTILGLAAGIFLFIFNYNKNHSVGTSLLIVMMMAVPLVLAGILFIISHSRKKKEQTGIH